MGHEVCLSGPRASAVSQLASIYSNSNNNASNNLGNNPPKPQLISKNISILPINGLRHQKLKASELESATRKLWRKADAVCFDVDSTVCQAIDELAHYLGKGQEVAACTHLAMGGNMTFREALAIRLNLMKPNRQQLEQYVQTHPIRLTPGIADLIAELRRKNVDVYLVSGGFRSIIKPVAELLNIDPNEPTSDSGSKHVGKAGVCGLLKTKKSYNTLIMVGDGATDAEACPPADAFIGFGGNQVRESVKKLSDWYVHDFKTLMEELAVSQEEEL
uniref:Phosphoserine phosphatase n=1 Tax=Ditylenchus dipsaci TaxID=166011 RepID=A0A915EIG1_9BILA